MEHWNTKRAPTVAAPHLNLSLSLNLNLIPSANCQEEEIKIKRKIKKMPRYSALLLSATLACCHSALADTIIFPTGERLAGKVVSEDATNVVFESKALGRIEVPRARIEKIERTEP